MKTGIKENEETYNKVKRLISGSASLTSNKTKMKG